MRCGGSAQGAGVLPGGPGCGGMGGLGAAGMPGERDRSRTGLSGQLAQHSDGAMEGWVDSVLQACRENGIAVGPASVAS